MTIEDSADWAEFAGWTTVIAWTHGTQGAAVLPLQKVAGEITDEEDCSIKLAS